VRMVSTVKWSGLSEGPYLKIIDTLDPAAVLELGESKSCFTKVYTTPLGTRGFSPGA
jgi:hypothetical protein